MDGLTAADVTRIEELALKAAGVAAISNARRNRLIALAQAAAKVRIDLSAEESKRRIDAARGK